MDGRGNAGPTGAAACVMKLEDGRVLKISKRLGEVTNSVAEYEGVVLALRFGKFLGVSDIRIFSDSQSTVYQLQEKYRVSEKGLHLVPLINLCWVLASSFTSTDIQWIRRELNVDADHLCTVAYKPRASRKKPARPKKIRVNPFRSSPSASLPQPQLR